MISLLEENESIPDVLPFRSWSLRIARVLYDNGITTWTTLASKTWNQIFSTPKLRERDIHFLHAQLENRGLTFRDNPAPPPIIRQFVPRWGNHVQSYSGVYFVECGPFVKIGITSNFAERMVAFKLHNPMPLRYLAKFLYTAPVAGKKEKELHRLFRDLHHYGEWFRLEQPIYDYLESFRIGVSEVRSW